MLWLCKYSYFFNALCQKKLFALFTAPSTLNPKHTLTLIDSHAHLDLPEFDPDRDAVYDFLPDSLLPSVANLDHFAGALVFDKWAANSDARQAIFFRGRLREYLDESAHPNQKGFVAQMVDHGYAFDGPHWDFADSPLQGLYFRPLVYRHVRSLEDFEPWLSRARHCPEAVFDEILRTTPRAWVEGEESAWEQLLEKLYRRRNRIEDLLTGTIRARPQSFPEWRR